MKTSQLGVKESKDKDELDQKFKDLVQHWDTLKQSITSNNNIRRYSTDHHYSNSTNTIINVKSLSLLENSPRDLMSSLQHRWPSSSEAVRERKAAIESGKVKGRRRLFGESEMGFEDREEICNDYRDSISSCGSYGDKGNFGNLEKLVHDCRQCCSCWGSSLSDERVEREERVVERERVEFRVEEKRVGNGGMWMLVMGWFAFTLMAVTLVIISMRCNINGGGYGDEDEVIPFPT